MAARTGHYKGRSGAMAEYLTKEQIRLRVLELVLQKFDHISEANISDIKKYTKELSQQVIEG